MHLLYMSVIFFSYVNSVAHPSHHLLLILDLGFRAAFTSVSKKRNMDHLFSGIFL